jgi:dihydrofolate reductase
MDAIVAVYSDWGIGAAGTQQVVLKADRRHFRQLTDGAAVIVGRKTMEDFPGGQPLKGRHNIVVTRRDIQVPGAAVVHDEAEALAEAAKYDRCLVIGGASVFLEFLPHTDRIFITKIDLAPHSDVFSPI